MPLVGRPMELIMPPSTSDTRGGGLPARNSRDTVFATSAPSRFKSITCARSVEKHPDAGMIGFLSVTLPIFTLMSTIRPPPADRTPAHRYRPAQLLLAVDLEGAHADVTRAEPAGHHLLHGDLAGDAVRLAEALHQLEQPVGAAGEKCIG